MASDYDYNLCDDIVPRVHDTEPEWMNRKSFVFFLTGATHTMSTASFNEQEKKQSIKHLEIPTENRTFQSPCSCSRQNGSGLDRARSCQTAGCS